MAMTSKCEGCGQQVSVSPRARMMHYQDECRAHVKVPPQVANTCTWEADYEGIWNTLCGDNFVFNDDGPEAHGFKFCPYCGKPLIQVKPAPE